MNQLALSLALSDWYAPFVGAVPGVIVGGLLTLLYQRWSQGQRRFRSALRVSRAASSYDPRSDGILTLWLWSPSRRLSQASLRTLTVRPDTPRHHILSGPTYDSLVADLEHQGVSGDNVHVLKINRDFRESARSQNFEVTLTRCSYAEVIASHRLVTSNEHLQRDLAARFEGSVDDVLDVLPPTSTSANILVLSSRGRALALRRSNHVQLFPSQWGLGINETMKFHDEAGATEDFFSVVYRGLEEELGLFRDDYSAPHVTALTYAVLDDFGITAVVRLLPHISEAEVLDRMSRSHSSFEHDDAKWIRVRKRLVETMMNEGRVRGVDGEWVFFSRFSMRELWRYRNA